MCRKAGGFKSSDGGIASGGDAWVEGVSSGEWNFAKAFKEWDSDGDVVMELADGEGDVVVTEHDDDVDMPGYCRASTAARVLTDTHKGHRESHQ